MPPKNRSFYHAYATTTSHSQPKQKRGSKSFFLVGIVFDFRYKNIATTTHSRPFVLKTKLKAAIFLRFT
jgi:hypothetical protein